MILGRKPQRGRGGSLSCRGLRYSFAAAVITAVGALVVFMVMHRSDDGSASSGVKAAGRG